MATDNRPKERDPREQLLIDQINNIHGSLVTAAEQDVGRMPERVFKEIWLPFFAGDNPLPYEVTLNHWVNFAGSPSRQVRVVDTNGKVLFTVPPLFNRDAINPLSSSDKSIAHVVISAEQYSGISPIQGQRYLDGELKKRALIMRVPAAVMTNLKSWNDIFQRYGRPAIATATADEPNKTTPGDDIDYDVAPL